MNDNTFPILAKITWIYGNEKRTFHTLVYADNLEQAGKIIDDAFGTDVIAVSFSFLSEGLVELPELAYKMVAAAEETMKDTKDD